MEIDLDYKYYYVINSDLKMSKGKIAAQVSHVAMKLGQKHGKIGRAVVCKANTEFLKYCILFPSIEYIEDAGLTEVPAGSLTCIGFFAGTVPPNWTEHLKLV